MRIRTALEQAGHEPVIFHANGVGGPAMEKLVEAGALAGVIDYTLSELANSLLDGLHATGPDRLRAAGAGAPWSFPAASTSSTRARDTLPAEYRTRQSYYHNPVATLVGSSRVEMAELGGIVAERLNEARGPVHVLAPTLGFSLADVEGDLWFPADAAFLDALGSALRPDIPLELVDTHVNDPGFADLVAERYLALPPRPRPGSG